jgi:hypothetical protein
MLARILLQQAVVQHILKLTSSCFTEACIKYRLYCGRVDAFLKSCRLVPSREK